MALQHQGRGAQRVGQEAFNYYIRGRTNMTLYYDWLNSIGKDSGGL